MTSIVADADPRGFDSETARQGHAGSIPRLDPHDQARLETR